MSCKVNKKNNKIISVTDRQGNESKLFREIASLPYINSLEDALETYKQVYNSTSAEQGLSFESNNKIFSNLKDALKENEEIEVKVLKDELLETIYTIPVQYNKSTKEGFVSSYIRDGLLNDKKVIYKGESFFVPKGENFAEKQINSIFLEQEAKKYLGSYNVTVDNGMITLSEGKNFVKEESHDSIEVALTEKITKEVTQAKTKNEEKNYKPTSITEDQLKLKLLDVLNKLGIETLSISNYVSKYSDKNGIEPSATALADIANRVVAFKEGNASLEDLTEETLHFIVEALPQEQVDELLNGIESTEEYLQFADQYREIYSREYPQDQVENLVNKEILAKVMKSALLNKVDINNQQSLFQRILQTIQQFFSKITTQNTYSELNNINSLIEDLFIKDNLTNLNKDNLTEDRLTLYSISNQSSGDVQLDKLRAINKSIFRKIQTGINFLNQSKSAVAVENQELRNLESILDSVTNAGTVMDFLALIKRKIEILDAAIKQAEKDGGTISIDNLNVLNNLRSGLRDLLAAQKNEIQNLDPSMLGFEDNKTLNLSKKKQKNELLKKIDEVNLQIEDLIGAYKNLETDSLNNIVDRVIQQSELTDEQAKKYRDFVLNETKEKIKETGFFMSTFGQIIHASDPLLNLTANVISELRYKEIEWTQKAFRPFANLLDDLNITPDQLSKELVNNGYVLDEIDHGKFKETVKQIESDAYNEVMGTEYSTEELSKVKKEGSLPTMTPKQATDYTDKRLELLDPYLEKPMNSTYYDAQKEKYENLGISSDTIKWLKSLSASRAVIQNDARQEDGTIIYNESQKEQLKSVSRRRKNEKSFYNSLGNIKNGINVQNVNTQLVETLEKENIRYVERGGLIYTLKDNPDIKAKRAFDISLIDEQYKNDLTERNNDTSKFVGKFFEISKDSFSEGVEFVKNNLGVSLSSEFWEKVTREPILDNEYVNSFPENASLIADIKELSIRRNEIKKLYQDSSNPMEIEGNEMERSAQEQIKTLTDSIEANKRLLTGINDVEVSEAEIEVTRGANRAYFRSLDSEGIEPLSYNEQEYIKKHLSKFSDTSFSLSLITADKLDSNQEVSESQQSKLDTYKRPDETYKQAAIRYGRTVLLPYYQRYTPEGYETLDDVIDSTVPDQENAQNIVDFINRVNNDSNYELNVHYTFQPDSDNGFVNPNYNKNYEGGYLQPKLDLFRNEEFFNKFGNVKKENGKIVEVSQNKDLFKAREALLELQRDNLKDIGEYKSHNLFLLPQISRTGLEKTTDFIQSKDKTKTVKEILKDIFQYRIDDKEYGEQENSVNITEATDAKIVPKLYIRDLEESSDVSKDIYYSYLMMTKQSKLYKARMEGIADIMSLEEKILDRNYAEGKSAQATTNYKMFQSYINNNFYNIRETRHFKANLPLLGEVDFTKFFRVVAKYIKVRNLGGLNLVTPFTSLITAESQVAIERILGEYINNDSLRLASSEFRSLFKDASKQSLEYNDTSKIQVLGEYLGAYEQGTRQANAKYGVMMRTLPKLGFIAHQMGNFPIIPRIFLTELYDNRVINGRIMNKNQFIKARKPLVKKDVYETEWKKNEDNAIYNYLNVTEDTVEFKPELIDLVGGDTEYLNNKMNGIRKRINQTSQFIDTQISDKDRTDAQRNALFSFITMHRSFLSIGLTRRFKDLQYNIEQGQYEEGTYVTLKNTIIDAFGNVAKSENKSKDFIKALRDAYKNPNTKGLTEEEAQGLRKRNLDRIGVEFGVLSGIVLLAAIVKGFADDPDNEDIYSLQLSNYLLLRLANETSSSQLGILNETASLVKTPVVGYQNIVNLLQVGNIFDSDVITKGTYKGLSKSDKYWIKTLPGLQSYYDLYEPKKKANTYQFYNQDNIDWASLGLFSVFQ